MHKWLIECTPSKDTGPAATYKQQAAREAVLNIGTNAVPTLLYWLSDNPPVWMEYSREAMDGVSKKLTDSAEPNPNETMSMQRGCAIRGFNIIGTNVPWVLPALSNGLATAKNRHARTYAFCLQGLGTNALPCLFAALNKPGMEEREGIAMAIAGVFRRQPDAGSAWVPILVPLIGDRDERVASQAAICLGRCGHGSSLAVAALTKAAKDNRSRVRRAAIVGLGYLGSATEPAIDLVQASLQDRDLDIREAATNALQKITEAKQR